ncbi:hypothetical protein T12_14573 [Trichinella patagoniensis]|uniref:Uncharacterized protein n=1 Tax=Trichinella patagoniensis TaxID=990121 RepID=A0A0V0Z5M5_9BILA|nr:hypothetical protein T12_14573 [Trichinella patagoniensis]
MHGASALHLRNFSQTAGIVKKHEFKQNPNNVMGSMEFFMTLWMISQINSLSDTGSKPPDCAQLLSRSTMGMEASVENKRPIYAQSWRRE